MVPWLVTCRDICCLKKVGAIFCELSSWKFQVQLPNFSMILPAGVIRDDFVFLGHGSCVNQPLGPAGSMKPGRHGHELAHPPPKFE